MELELKLSANGSVIIGTFLDFQFLLLRLVPLIKVELCCWMGLELQVLFKISGLISKTPGWNILFKLYNYCVGSTSNLKVVKLAKISSH